MLEFDVVQYYCYQSPAAVYRRITWDYQTESSGVKYLDWRYRLQVTCESVSFAGLQLNGRRIQMSTEGRYTGTMTACRG
jgi:hypothetical protein